MALWRLLPQGSAEIGDLDMVVITEDGRLDGNLFKPAVDLPSGIVWQRGRKHARFGDLTLEIDGHSTTLHIDVWACKPNERGAFLWYCTGPKELNVVMRQRALQRGMHLLQFGLTNVDKSVQLDDGTEQDIARLLDWPMLTPAERHSWAGRREMGS
jgi:DNA polymerase/3'-5' exonuclease PolX